MLAIRLQRLGKAKQPTYRLIINEKTRDTQGRSLEILGNYQPLSKDKKIVLDTERIKYWLSKGAQCSNTVHNLLLKQGITDGKKRKSVSISKKRAEKIAKKKATVPAA